MSFIIFIFLVKNTETFSIAANGNTPRVPKLPEAFLDQKGGRRRIDLRSNNYF